LYPFHLGKVHREFWQGGGKCRGRGGNAVKSGRARRSALSWPWSKIMPNTRRFWPEATLSCRPRNASVNPLHQHAPVRAG